MITPVEGFLLVDITEEKKKILLPTGIQDINLKTITVVRTPENSIYKKGDRLYVKFKTQLPKVDEDDKAIYFLAVDDIMGYDRTKLSQK